MVKVKVCDGYAVAADGEQHSDGSTVEIDQVTAEKWQVRGWVELAKPASAKRTGRRKVAKRVRVGGKRVWLLSGRVCRDCSAEFQGTVRTHFCWPCQLRRHGHGVDESAESA